LLIVLQLNKSVSSANQFIINNLQFIISAFLLT
jgi:hypothetical protein